MVSLSWKAWKPQVRDAYKKFRRLIDG